MRLNNCSHLFTSLLGSTSGTLKSAWPEQCTREATFGKPEAKLLPKESELQRLFKGPRMKGTVSLMKPFEGEIAVYMGGSHTREVHSQRACGRWEASSQAL